MDLNGMSACQAASFRSSFEQDEGKSFLYRAYIAASAAFVSLSSRTTISSLTLCRLLGAGAGGASAPTHGRACEVLPCLCGLPLSVGLGPVAQVVRAHP